MLFRLVLHTLSVFIAVSCAAVDADQRSISDSKLEADNWSGFRPVILIRYYKLRRSILHMAKKTVSTSYLSWEIPLKKTLKMLPLF